MITIRDKETQELLGSISEDELQTLVDAFEEESGADNDYYVDAQTVEMLEEDGASASLVAFLTKALGSREGVEIQWSRA